jgi:hypothetical protein
VVLAGVVGLSACGTEPDDAPLAGMYVGDYEPSRLVSTTLDCDRLVSYALLAVNTLEDFDLSLSVTDDCSRAGGGFAFFEVLKLGKYTRQGSTLVFTPDSEPTAEFNGELEGEFVRLTLPPGFGNLAPNQVELRVGPRSPL